MSNYIVYELWNPIKDLPFYVGYSSKDDRPYDHIVEALQDKSECKKGANPHKIFTIRQIHNINLAVGIKIVLMTDNKHAAISEEIRLIKYYGRKDGGSGILTNMTDGEDGAGTRIWTEEQRLNASQLKSGKSFEELFGPKRADEIKKKISNSRQGIKTGKPAWNTGKTKDNDELLMKMSNSKKGLVPFNKGKKMNELIPGYINHFTGKTHSEESKQKVSMANKGRCAGEKNPMFGKSAVKGRKWYHDGATQFYLFDDDPKIVFLSLHPGRLKNKIN